MRNHFFGGNPDLLAHTAIGETANATQLQRLLASLPRALEQELTPRQQQLVELYFFQNMSISQIAQTLQLHPSTVSRTLHRAVLRLQRVLQYAV